MPELPDLTVFAENLSKQVVREKVVKVVWHERGRLNVGADELSGALVGSSISEVERSGKETLFKMNNGNRLFVHLMLQGKFVLAPRQKTASFPIMTLAFEDGKTLTVQDPKAMVMISLNPSRDHEAPDALELNPELLKRLIGVKPRMLAKAFLIDQKIVRGIGNAYADEILWKAAISPRSVMGTLPEEAIDELVRAVHSVLNSAIEQLRRDHPAIIAGEIRDFLAVHNPSRKVSPTGHPIQVETISSKKTYFTDEQVLYPEKAVKHGATE